jgi:hypothetical protein
MTFAKMESVAKPFVKSTLSAIIEGRQLREAMQKAKECLLHQMRETSSVPLSAHRALLCTLRKCAHTPIT